MYLDYLFENEYNKIKEDVNHSLGALAKQLKWVMLTCVLMTHVNDFINVNIYYKILIFNL